MSAERESAAALDRSGRAAVASIMLGLFVVFLDATVVNVAVHALTLDLGADLASVQWVVTAYLLALAGALPVAGWLATRYGASRVFLGALALFTAGSLLCAFAGDLGWLVAFRVLQGAGGGLVGALGQAMVVHVVPRERIHRVIGLIGLPLVVAPIVGPLLGGALVSGPGWRWIFLVTAPIGLLAIAVAARWMPRVGPGDAGPLDVVGLLLACLGVVGIVGGAVVLGEGDRLLGAAALLGGLALTAAFVRWSARPARRPLLALWLFRGPAFGPAALACFLTSGVLYGGILVMPLYYQTARALDPTATGLLMMPGGIGAAAAVFAVRRLIPQIGAAATGIAAVVAGSLATVPFVLLDEHSSIVVLSVAMAVRGACVAAVLIAMPSIAYAAVERSEINQATTQINLVQRLGSSFGTIAVVLAMTAAGGAAQGASAYVAGFWCVLAATVVAGVAMLRLRGVSPVS